MSTLTRAERNNNFGNLNYIVPPHAYNGQIGLEDGPNARFGKYDTPFNGARAAYMQILANVLTHGQNTVDKIVDSWAPVSDGNAVNPYKNRVCGTINDAFEATGDDVVTPTTNITDAVKVLSFLAALGSGIFIVESGHFPVNLDNATNRAAALSALKAKGLA